LRIAETLRAQFSAADEVNARWLRASLDGNRQEAYLAIKEGLERVPSAGQRYQLGWEAIKMNYPHEAVEVYSALDPNHPELRGWTAYWDRYARALHMIGDHGRELEVVRRGREMYPEQASFLFNELRALAALGRIEEIRGILEGVYETDPDPADAVSAAALELAVHGNGAKAQALWDELLEWADAFYPDAATNRATRATYAEVLYRAGRYEEAFRIYEAILADDPTSVTYRGYVGVTAARIGDTGIAYEMSQELESLAPPGPLNPGLSGRTFWRARIASVLGEKDEAVRLIYLAHEQGANYGPGLHRNPDLIPLHDYPPFIELLRPKG
jgi:tetratricopeptide (TPR) repeat protein